jgi:hypothetical protein
MKSRSVIVISLLLATASVFAEDAPEAGENEMLAATSVPAGETPEAGEKQLSGMSIVGDHEAPKSLVIVPWKSSELAARLDVSRLLDDGLQPVDKEVFMRELEYYQIRAE